MARDGSITIGTALDLEGFKKGYAKLEKGTQNLVRNASGMIKTISNAFDSSKVERTSAAIMKQQALVDELKEKLRAISEIEAKAPMVEEIQRELDEAIRMSNSFRKTLEDIERSAKVGGGLATPGQLRQVEEYSLKFENATNKANELQHKLTQIQLPTQPKESAEELGGKLEIAEQKLSEMKNRAEQTNVVAKKASGIATGISKILSKIGSFVGNAGKKVATLAGKFLSVGKNANKANKSVGGIGKAVENTLKRIKNLILSALIFNVLRKVFKDLGDYVSVALKDNETFAKSFAQLKGNIATIAQPILDVAVPAIAEFVKWLATGTQYLVQFMAALSGKTVKSLQSAAKNMDNLNKKSKGFLATFDEINQIGKDTEDLEIAPEYADIADVELDWIDEAKEKIEGLTDALEKGFVIGDTIAVQISNLLDNIDWDNIKEKAKNIAESIAGFLSGFAGNPNLWISLGKTFGEGINTALNFLDTIFTKTNWATIGQGLANGLMSMINSVDWALLGKTVADGLNALFTLIYNFFTTANWLEIGVSIGTAIKSAVSTFNWALLGQTIAAGINSAFNFLLGLIQTIPWAEIGTGIAESINNVISNTNWGTIGVTLGNGISGILKLASKALKDINWFDVGAAINDFITAVPWGEIGSTLLQLIGNVLIGLGQAFSQLDPPIQAIIMTLGTFLAIVKGIQFAIELLKFAQMIQGLFGIGTAGLAAGAGGTTAGAGLTTAGAGASIAVGPILAIAGAILAAGISISGIILSIGYLVGKFTELQAAGGSLLGTVLSIVAVLAGTIIVFALLGPAAATAGAQMMPLAISIGIISAAVALLINSITELLRVIGMLGSVGSFGNIGIGGGSNSITAFNANGIVSSSYSIPQLATGTVVPPNREFLAVLGDNKQETEVVSPLSTMKQAFIEAMAEMGGIGNNGSDMVTVPISLELDGQVLYQSNQRVARGRGFAQPGLGAFAR